MDWRSSDRKVTARLEGDGFVGYALYAGGKYVRSAASLDGRGEGWIVAESLDL
jgi:hypothetical protein